MGFLATMPQDEAMTALKESTLWPALPLHSAARGRDNYSLLGALRTKPGRLDSPPTNSMSCSDKIALWNVVGLQGSLLSNIMRPIYLSAIIIGDVPSEIRTQVEGDCMRAFSYRVQSVVGCLAYLLQPMRHHFSRGKQACLLGTTRTNRQ